MDEVLVEIVCLFLCVVVIDWMVLVCCYIEVYWVFDIFEVVVFIVLCVIFFFFLIVGLVI